MFIYTETITPWDRQRENVHTKNILKKGSQQHPLSPLLILMQS